MTFLSIIYGLFFLSTLGIFWSVERRSLRLWVLLIASLVFYSSLQIQYVPLLLAITLVTFYGGQAIGTPMDWRVEDRDWPFAQQDWNRRRLALLWIGIGLNLLLLLGFKYVPFLLESFGGIAGIAGANEQADWIRQHVIAPLGISS